MTASPESTPGGPLPYLAVLLGQPGRPADVVLAQGWFAPPRLPDVDTVLWGQPPLAAGAGGPAAAAAALRRARALARLRRRPPTGRAVRAVHRLDPPALQTGARSQLRRLLLQGAIAEIVRVDAPPRVLDLVCHEACVDAPSRFRLGAGGALLATVELPAGAAVLRVGVAGSGGDPAAAATALEQLAGNARVPRLLVAGMVGGASWSLEERLSGRRPTVVSASLLREVGGFCATLPRTGRPASVRHDLNRLADLLPSVATQLRSVATHADPVLSGLPGVARHGDLWSGNLLVERGRLSAVLDWDAWRTDGVPGTDLLHLTTTEERLRSRRPLGAVFRDQPWEWPALTAAEGSYWRALGLDPSRAERRAVGTAWWAAQVGSDLARTPTLGRDARWVQANVLDVLDLLR